MPTKARDHGSNELDTNLIKNISLQKGSTLWLISVLFTSSFRYVKRSKFQMQRKQWRRMGKTREKSGMEADESQKQKRSDRGSKKNNGRHCWVFVILRIRSWSLQYQKHKGGVELRGTLQKTTLEPLLYLLSKDQQLLSKDQQHLKWQPKKSWTLNHAFQDFQDMQLMQYQLILGSKWRRINVVQNSKVSMTRYWDTSTEAQMAQIMHGPVWKTQLFVL